MSYVTTIDNLKFLFWRFRYQIPVDHDYYWRFRWSCSWKPASEWIFALVSVAALASLLHIESDFDTLATKCMEGNLKFDNLLHSTIRAHLLILKRLNSCTRMNMYQIYVPKETNFTVRRQRQQEPFDKENWFNDVDVASRTNNDNKRIFMQSHWLIH